MNTNKVKIMCRLYNRKPNCEGCPLATRPQRCNVNMGNPQDIAEVEQLVDTWSAPTNGEVFIKVFGEDAFKRLCHESDFAAWASEL